MAENIVGICVGPKVGETKTGKPYVSFDLQDMDARTPVRIWDSEHAPCPGMVVELVSPTKGDWQGSPQYTATGWVESDEPRSNYVEPATMLRGEVILQGLLDAMEGFIDPAICTARAALESIEKLALLDAPAARGHHHARPGGLLEHTWSMFQLADELINHYDYLYGNCAIDRGVLIAAVVLHDLGKLVEMSGPYASEYTTEGRLIGHIVIGAEMVDRFAPPELSEERKRNLKHCILSHHGKLEWGSPVVPQTPEAILLHQIDMLDSRMDPVLSRAAAGEKGWVSMGYGKGVYLGGE